MSESNTGLSICEKTSYELVEFEEAVNSERGAWLKFSKMPLPEHQGEAAVDAKGKAPAKKGKGPAVDDLKPTFGRAWVSFEDLQTPGATNTVQRVHVTTCAPANEVEEDGVKVW